MNRSKLIKKLLIPTVPLFVIGLSVLINRFIPSDSAPDPNSPGSGALFALLAAFVAAAYSVVYTVGMLIHIFYMGWKGKSTSETTICFLVGIAASITFAIIMVNQ